MFEEQDTGFDFFITGVFHSCKGQFALMMAQGHSLQDCQEVVKDLQLAVQRSLQVAGTEAAIKLDPSIHETPDQSERNPFNQ